MIRRLLPLVQSGFPRREALRTFAGFVLLVGIVCILCLDFFSSQLRAADASAPNSADAPTTYRRIFVPADKVDAWPTNGDKFIPVESRDFNALVEAANHTEFETSGATIDSAEYVGRLDNDQRVQGHGTWRITVHGDKPVYLPLGQTSVVIRGAHWQNAENHAARIGVWGNAHGDLDQLALEAPRSGVLEFDWTTPARSPSDEIEIPLQLPTATSTHVILDLPAGKQPHLDGGVVVATNELAQKSTPDSRPAKRWTLAVSPSKNAKLRVTGAGHESSPPAALSTLREETSYRIEQRGLEISATWQLERGVSEQRTLTVPLPRGAQIVSVEENTHTLVWTVVRGSVSAPDRAIITLPKDNLGVQNMAVHAWCPLVVDHPWQLPTLRPDDVFWSSGKIQLSIAPEFELRGFVPLDCAQTGVAQATAEPKGQETYSLVSFSPTATLEIGIARRQPNVMVRVGSSLVLADPDVSGRLVTELSVTRDSVHHLSGELAAGWNLENVETIPADAIAEWFVERHGKQQTIDIQLTDAVTPTRNVTVIITGRLQRTTIAEPIPVHTLRIIDWAGARVTRQLLSFQSTEPFAVESLGELPTAARESISNRDLALLDSAADDNRIVDLAGASRDAGLQLTFKRGQFAADIELDSTYGNGELRNLYHIQARPKGNPIDRLLIFATAPLGDNLRWSEASSDSPIVAVRLPADDPQRKNLPNKDGELWSLRLPQPTTAPVSILVSATTPWKTRAAVPLLAIPEAVEQHGHVAVRGDAINTPGVEPIGLTPVPLSSATPEISRTDETQTVRAEFRFNPSECLEAARTPRLFIRPPTNSGTTALVSRFLDLESFYWANGRTSHRATYELKNFGATEFNTVLPAGARLNSISVNGQPIELAVNSDGQPLAPIHLQPGVAIATVSFCFETQQANLAAGRELTPPLVQSGIPVLAGQWTVWLPDEYSANLPTEPGNQALDWRQRFFGPLARSNVAAPFNPLRPADWARLLNGLVDWRSTTSPEASTGVLRGDDSKASSSKATTGTAQAGQPTTLSGWHAYHEQFAADAAPQPIRVSHPAAITAWSVAVFLACLLIGRKLCRNRITPLLVLVPIAAAMALLLPAEFAPLATGAMWGLVCVLLVDWPLRSLAANIAPNRRRMRMAFVGLLVALVAIGLANIASAERQESATAAHDDTAPIERVLIPVDADNRPLGSKYYLSEQFLRKLMSTEVAPNQLKRQWLLRDAACSGELSEDRGHADVAAGTLTLKFAIETLVRDATVILPLVRDEAAWQPVAMLDGVPITPEWLNSGRKCAFEIRQPGQYSLTLYCVPKTQVTESGSQFTLSIPPLLSAAVQLHAPDTLTGVAVANSILTTPAKLSRGDLAGELVQADHLTVRWPHLETKSSTSQGLKAAEMGWLHVGAAGTELDTKYVIEGGSRRPETLSIVYDDRWKLLTKTIAVERPRENGSRQHTIQIPLPSEDTDRQEVSLQWQLQDAPSIGSFRLPPIGLTSLPATQRWFALSADPSLECTVADNTASDGTAKEFLTKWRSSSSGDAPQVVLANLDPARVLTLTVRPHETESVVRDLLHVAVGLRACRVVYQANVTPGSQNRFQYRLTLPGNLSIDDVTVMQTDRQIPAHWTRGSDNSLNVFFDKEATSDYRLTLAATLPIDPQKKFTIPHIATASSPSTAQQVQLYRDDNVRVELKDFPAPEESKTVSTDLPPVQWVVRPIGVFRLDEAAEKAAQITVQENKPELVGDTLTLIAHDTRPWSAAFRCHFTVKKGDLDRLRLHIPPTWTGPFEVESSSPASAETASPDEHNPDIAIRFASTVKEWSDVDLQIRGPLAMPATSPISVPEISLSSLAVGHRYILVPLSIDSQPVAWSEVGVRQAKIPQKLLPAASDLANQLPLEVTQDPFHVAVRSQAAPQPAPQIRLADTTISSGTLGGQLIVTRLIVVSDGLPNCVLQLPENETLLSATLDGQLALVTPLEATRWQLALGPAHLPQVLEIVSRTPSTGSSERLRELRRPTLIAGDKPIPVEVSLWSIARPLSSSKIEIEGAASVSPVDQAALRFDRLVSIAESAATIAVEAPAPDGKNWFQPWAAMLQHVQDETRRTLAQPTAEPAVVQVSHSSEDQINRASKRLADWLQHCGEHVAAPGAPASNPLSATNEANPHVAPANGANETTCYVAEGGADRLVLKVVLAHATPTQTRVLGLLLIVSLTMVSAWFFRTPAAADFLCRWPQLLGILVGLAYWAWLWPSFVGLLIVAISFWLGMRFHWPGRAIRPEASTVLRSTRSR